MREKKKERRLFVVFFWFCCCFCLLLLGVWRLEEKKSALKKKKNIKKTLFSIFPFFSHRKITKPSIDIFFVHISHTSPKKGIMFPFYIKLFPIISNYSFFIIKFPFLLLTKPQSRFPFPFLVSNNNNNCWVSQNPISFLNFKSQQSTRFS